MAEVIVAVLGGIGIGKSEFIKSMKSLRLGSKLPSVLITPGELKVYEESKRVKDIAASVFYPAFQRGDRYGCFGAEVAMLAARADQMVEAARESGIAIVERIPEENRHVFFENDFRSGLFGDPEKDGIAKYFYDSYCATYAKLRNRTPTPDVFVYIDVAPEVALRRVMERGRKSESEMSLEYLTNVQSLYNELVEDILPNEVPRFGDKLVRIDANNDLSKSDLKRFHLQIEERIVQALRRQGWGSGETKRAKITEY